MFEKRVGAWGERRGEQANFVQGAGFRVQLKLKKWGRVTNFRRKLKK